jgi:hypothetical protein
MPGIEIKPRADPPAQISRKLCGLGGHPLRDAQFVLASAC